MTKIRVPASASNLGPGFDCLGLALGLYNTFEFEPAEETVLEGAEPRFNNNDNLFLQGYRAAGGTGCLHVTFETEIPVSRGLGSSASLLTGGVLAAWLLNGTVDRNAVFQLVSDMEGHPDNAAAAVFGGLTASMKGPGEDAHWITRSLKVSDLLRFTVMIPDYEIQTGEARAILPADIPLAAAAANTGRAVLTCQGLASGDVGLLRAAERDLLHEPFRSGLIPHYDIIRTIAEEDTGGVTVISGSGSTCLLISDRPLGEQARFNLMILPEHWNIRELPVADGPEILENGVWQAII